MNEAGGGGALGVLGSEAQEDNAPAKQKQNRIRRNFLKIFKTELIVIFHAEMGNEFFTF